MHSRKIFIYLFASISIYLLIGTSATSHLINTQNEEIFDENLYCRSPTFANNSNELLNFDFTFIWMSDTQYYSQNYPHIYKNITSWIANNKNRLNISYVIHTGDIVQNFLSYREWQCASNCMEILDENNIPYGVLAGNHDNALGIFHFLYYLFFGCWRFINKEYCFGNLYFNQNHYDLISAGGLDFVIIYLSYGITNYELKWANRILNQYNDRHAIIAMHEYIKKGGSYSGQGEEIFDNLVVPNDNVFMVLCGHKHDVERNIKNLNGRIVYEILSNYQDTPKGGNGYCRLLFFDVSEGLIHFKTYSPYLDDYNFHPAMEDEFILDFNSEI